MKSQTVIGVAFLVMAAGLGAFELLLPKLSTTEMAEAPLSQSSGEPRQSELPITGPDWQSQQPRHEAIPPRKHPVVMHHKKQPHHKPSPKPVHHAGAPAAPLPGPSFLPESSERAPRPAPTVRIDVGQQHGPVMVDVAPPVYTSSRHSEHVAPIHHRIIATPRPKPTIYAPPTFSPADLARQRTLERQALINAAVRSARGTVQRSVTGASIVSADAEDHGRYISVVVVEERSSGTVVESFTFTPGASGLGLSERHVISQNYADPFISH
jgi:hypothetical protein